MRDQTPLPADRALRVRAQDAAGVDQLPDALQHFIAVDIEVRGEALLTGDAVRDGPEEGVRCGSRFRQRHAFRVPPRAACCGERGVAS